MTSAPKGTGARGEGADEARVRRRQDERLRMESTFDRLWPLLRSLTGEGVRRTHDILAESMPLERIEIPSGTRVHDWTVPPEWVVREAFVRDPSGQRILDVRENNLHLVNYARPFRGTLSRAELDAHLYSLPEMPEAIPYVTSYYAPAWGFCLSDRQRRALPEGDYEVAVDTELVDGSMTLSECVLPGESEREVFLTSYTCHPSLANNELSGPLLLAFLYGRLASRPRRRLTYRFVLAPETIGAIAYLSVRGRLLRERMVAGLVATCVGDDGAFTYKRTRDAPAVTDRAVEHVLAHGEEPYDVLDFVPTGSDERQYASPGYRLPVGSLTRTMYGRYPEYHTSLDDKSRISFEALQRTVDAYERVCTVVDGNGRYVNLAPFGEPRLAERGLYPSRSVAAGNVGAADAIFWVLNASDGVHDLLAVAERSGLPFVAVREAADRLVEAGLLEVAPEDVHDPIELDGRSEADVSG